MPAYLFTLHGHRTWMPDHPEGYTTRSEGARGTSDAMGRAYESQAVHARVVFEPDLQRWLIDELIRCQPFIDVRLHGASTESTHVHFLVSWSHKRSFERIRQSMRTSMTLRVRSELKLLQGISETDAGAGHAKPPVFSDGGTSRPVVDRDHFRRLMGNYLPNHSGLQWYEEGGWRSAV